MHATRALKIRDRSIPVVLPTLRDPRLHLASVIISLHILGQTVLHFELSIAQILISIFTSAALEFLIMLRRHRAIVWPASAMLTGNGVAFILRVPGTEHGEWWSTRGWWIFAATAAISLLSKYLLRRDGRHIFNPSNFGLLLCFLVLGSSRAEPLDFWWGSNSPRIYAALTIILIGGLVILSRLRMLAIAVVFWATFAICMMILGAADHCMTARWHVGPVCGNNFTRILATSPEVLVFMFFMITDPKTSPATRIGRNLYASSIAVIAALMIAPQRTEFATKVALLAALAIVCAARPMIDWLAAPTPSRGARFRSPLAVLSVVGCTAVLLIATSFGRSDLGAPAEATMRLRPEIRLERSDIPPVEVDNSNRISSQIEAKTANVIAVDTIVDLRIIGDAQRSQDLRLLSTAAAESWHDHLAKRITDEATRASSVVERYELSKITISLARRPGQGPPAVLVTLRGTKFSDQSAGGDTTTTTSLLHTTYEVKYINKHWLITTDQPPTGWTQP